MTPCVITIRFPVRVPLEENPIIISFRAINATETEEASGQSIVARNHELIARWTNEGQARDITSENRFVSAIIHRWKISAYCWKKINFQYKVHDETRPRLLAIFFSFFFQTAAALSVYASYNFPATSYKYIIDFLSSLCLFANCIGSAENSCKFNLPFDQRLIRCQELYLKIQRSGINARVENFYENATNGRENSLLLYDIVISCNWAAYEEKASSSFSLFFFYFLRSLISACYVSPSRYYIREYNIFTIIHICTYYHIVII